MRAILDPGCLVCAVVVCVMVLVSACGEGEPGERNAAPADTTAGSVGEVDLMAEAPVLRVGYVGHDHHAAVYVAASLGDRMREEYGIYLAPLREGELYALVEDNEKVAEIELFRASGGGSVVPTSMAAGEFDLGFGGVVAFAAGADQGTGIAIVSPAHSRGDMLVVGPGNGAVSDWASFLDWVRSSEAPVRVGYKNPSSVAVTIFEAALAAEGVAYARSSDEAGAEIVLINMNGEANLIPGLETGTIDAYVSNNPWCALAEHNGQGRCVAELSDLPPGTWRDHPCCAIAATLEAREQKADLVACFLRLIAAATDLINRYPQEAAQATADWLGNPVEVELVSMATSGYDMQVSRDWLANMEAMVESMRGLGSFSGPLADADWQAASSLIFDWSLLPAEYRPAD
ncbi:ABC transporter substrate-binding protein [Candidatus Fermentibacterales bacterium]|nr:ABC transporter substrate-binding protein [Candidatus Fermentibacterales bacterium]